MSEEIYQQAIKALAQAAHGAGRLAQPTASVRLDNALCGDRITLDLRIEGDTVAELAQETRGCLLCRAAASLLAREAPGRKADELVRTQAALASLLQQGDSAQALPWPELSIFAPVRAYKSRHGCVLLPFRALREAIDSGDSR